MDGRAGGWRARSGVVGDEWRAAGGGRGMGAGAGQHRGRGCWRRRHRPSLGVSHQLAPRSRGRMARTAALVGALGGLLSLQKSGYLGCLLNSNIAH